MVHYLTAMNSENSENCRYCNGVCVAHLENMYIFKFLVYLLDNNFAKTRWLNWIISYLTWYIHSSLYRCTDKNVILIIMNCQPRGRLCPLLYNTRSHRALCFMRTFGYIGFADVFTYFSKILVLYTRFNITGTCQLPH